jgi:uncharacterized membrane protein YuzA (DUF378 family)
MFKGCTMGVISKVLLVVGGLNWGLVGISMLMGKMDAWNVVHMLLGSWPMVEAIVYVLVGIVAVMKIFGGCHCSKCANCTCDSSK